MGALKKFAAAVGFAVLAFGVTAASADDRGRGGGYDRDGRGGYDRDGRGPDRCDDDHDHRSHDPRYYEYHPADRYSRAGDYRGGRYDDRYDDRRRYDDRYGYGYGGRRIVKNRVYDTRYRARIHLIEEEFRYRDGYRRVCTVEVRGPDRRYVPYGQARRVAANECSRRAEIRII